MKIKHSNKKLIQMDEENMDKSNLVQNSNQNKDFTYDNLDSKTNDNIEKLSNNIFSENSSTNLKLSRNINTIYNFAKNSENENVRDNKNKIFIKNIQHKEKQNYENGKVPQSLKYKFSESLIITDLDEFFKNIYEYYYNKGFNNILIQTILDNISYIFSIHFLALNIFFINWKQIIMNCKYENFCAIEISEYFSIQKFTDDFLENRIYFLIFYTFLIIYYFIFLIKSVILIKKMKFIKKIYDNKLKIRQSELENIKFDLILSRLISLQNSEEFCRIKENITKFDIISRIMREDNYLIALFSNGIIDSKIKFNINLKIPYLMKSEIYKKKIEIDMYSNFFFTKINESLIRLAFETIDKSLNKDFINLKSLRFRLFLFMIFEVIFLIPFVFLKTVFWIFKNADNIKSDKKTIFLNKNWKKRYQILFRNYNELQHYFDYRIYNSYQYLNDFNNCFKNKEKIFSIIKKFIKLILGSVLFLIFILSFFESKLLTELTIFGKNFVWIGIGVGVVLSLSEDNVDRGCKENPYLRISDNLNQKMNSLKNYDSDNRFYYYKKLLNSLMNIPKDWPDYFDNFSKINKKINLYFELSIISIIKELIAILFFPIVWIKLIINAEKIRQFIIQNSVDIKGIGTICTYSYFNYQYYKNKRDKNDVFLEFNFNDKKFFNSSFYFRVCKIFTKIFNFLSSNKNKFYFRIYFTKLLTVIITNK